MAEASEEARCLELGKSETTRFLDQRRSGRSVRNGGRTVLIGGPPCQAYSTAGRGRNAGIAGYVPHKDERHFLYQQYVDVLGKLEPAAFVMENVKGMLSSAVNGDRIFLRVMADLRSSAGPDSYSLFALSPSSLSGLSGFDPHPSDFIVCSEQHGVPSGATSSDHRRIAPRRADSLPNAIEPLVERHLPLVSVSDVIGAMPRQRSRLSRGDSTAAWYGALRDAVDLLQGPIRGLTEEQEQVFRAEIASLFIARVKMNSLRNPRVVEPGCPRPVRPRCASGYSTRT
jgi:DNA (cytosine-5)-methyltransferase 1